MLPQTPPSVVYQVWATFLDCDRLGTHRLCRERILCLHQKFCQFGKFSNLKYGLPECGNIPNALTPSLEYVCSTSIGLCQDSDLCALILSNAIQN